MLMSGCSLKTQKPVTQYEKEHYHSNVYEQGLFADTLCVAAENVELEQYEPNPNLHAAGLFGIEQKKVFLSERIHDRLYPASTTKLLTMYVALKYGTLSDVVTVSDNAVSVPSDSSVAWLRKGDKLTLKDLLYGLMLPSGNDSAVAIAEHISGDTEKFVELMNKEANMLGATNSHFVNPHGYHDENHYTTAYDLYLILNACIANETFLEVISAPSYAVKIEGADNVSRTQTWKQSNQFVNGARDVPEGVTVVGGKTGTTNEAGACLVLFSRNLNEQPYISIVMGAESKGNLYDTMTSLLAIIPEMT